jgi:SAM-dependent methyltransferase
MMSKSGETGGGDRRQARATGGWISGLLRSMRRAVRSPRVGAVNLGDLARIRPISTAFGFDRGTPIDRHYIEQFLSANADGIRGRVLEVSEDLYSRKFGTGVTQQDVLQLHEQSNATVVGDISQPGVLPHDAFDCMIVTQTLHLVYDLPAAVRHLHEALRPGGVLLATVPGVSSIDRGEWGESWMWSLTKGSALRLFGEVFGPANVTVGSYGNVYAATCFLHGLAVEEVERSWLDRSDDAYPVTIAISARR